MDDTNALITMVSDGPGNWRVLSNMATIGWVVEWSDRRALNETGQRLYRATPIGGVSRDDCRTKSSAIAYIKNYLSIP